MAGKRRDASPLTGRYSIPEDKGWEDLFVPHCVKGDGKIVKRGDCRSMASRRLFLSVPAGVDLDGVTESCYFTTAYEIA